ncbi:HD domain-containing protein, partial [Salmonella enterica subsp. enterica serovar Enteritidis]|nr:HD domain-containing protein [Salmonella enterica subsp. enterica serovar Enteritidis]
SNSTLSEMLTQHYYETLIEARLPDEQRPVSKVINERFKLVGDRIAVTHTRVFAQHPTAILEMFLLMGQQNIRHIRTRTLRILKIAARGIDEHFRNDSVNKALFMDNIKEQNLLFWRLRVMKRYGVLGSYLPAFGQIIGLMQYDLFHRYTVDAHILMLIRMLHRFTDDNYVDTYPLVSGIYRRIDRKEMLVLAAIFHDIAKGRGGDHSELGEQDAIKFCLSHGLSQADAEL